ncbi:M23 family metallopeptidase [Geomonas subterranea]|uniref:M23 family metallopeptidase n=1 Tax=Geomonas subterranea TaxID=2847989 RepID=A0ABX8LCI8_9BACT|nr:M23 family metallopeptidase [Geomonas subterranea]QXE89134.1 M23 family metallopeptidase [Geomonas subterranea]QXM08749.1 M23 family metallopeptidase [Geomonas subterranea]
MKRTKTKTVVGAILALLLLLLAAGICLPERLIIPVKGATKSDWNAKSFWFSPWGKSGVHKGIDIFAQEGVPVIAASSGLVVQAGFTPGGGNVVSVLGPKWRVHYYAHLKSINVTNGEFVSQGSKLGTVGSTGNAAGKQPHLHYAIITQIPYVWLFQTEKYGFDRMFFLNPHDLLRR